VEHRDPFDRLLAAQAMALDLILASNDEAFDEFEGLKRLG
jgi:PIN domain nuclease of toxin-antitoxin system